MCALKCEFLTAHFNWTGKEGDHLIIQAAVQVTSGIFYRMHGFDILHKISTDYGLSGHTIMMAKVLAYVRNAEQPKMIIIITLLFQLKL